MDDNNKPDTTQPNLTQPNPTTYLHLLVVLQIYWQESQEAQKGKLVITVGTS